jgi:hypothetical protein
MREDHIDQAERRETLENDRKVREAEHQRLLREGTTFHQHAQAFADEVNQGRFAAIGVPTVTGSTPVPSYPAAGAHQFDPCGPEPPLGYSVDQVEPIEPSTFVSSVEETCAPAGAAHAADNLPPASAESSDAGASFSQQDESR